MGIISEDGEKIILERLDTFIRKYYKNRIIKGSLLFLALVLAAALLIILGEFLFRFGVWARTSLFFLFCLSGLTLLIRFIFIPLMQLYKIGKFLSHEQAAKIIGEHFPAIQDKLLNTLQLIGLKKSHPGNIDLLVAGIDRKISEMKPYRFNQVIHFRKNLRYLRYLIPLLIIFFLISVLAPRMISEPVVRIVNFNRPFSPLLPYQIIVLNNKFDVLQQEDYEVRIKITGEEIPEEIFIHSGTITFRMNKEKPRIYTHLFNNLQSDTRFYITAGRAKTRDFDIRVFPRPTILEFSVALEFPAYINKASQKVENAGDLTVPEGTSATWNIYTKDVSDVGIRFGNETLSLQHKGGNVFSFSKRLNEPSWYSIRPANEYSRKADSLSYKIEIIKDGYPTISVKEVQDSLQPRILFYQGIIKDDYGFSKLLFHVESITPGDGEKPTYKEVEIPLEKNKNIQSFIYSVDLSSLMPVPGTTINYYFEIWDNDGINGPKSTKSEIRTIRTMTTEEVQKVTENNASDIQSGMEKSLKETRTISKDMDELKRKLIDQNNLSWLEKQKIEAQIKSLEKMSRDLEKVQKQNEENIKNEQEILKTNERILEKQKRLSEMMDQLLNEELKNMIKELKELLKEADREKMEEALSKIKMNNKELEQQLDRNLDLFKRFEFERKLNEQVSQIRKLADDQEKLAEKTENVSEKSENIEKEQDTIKSSFDSISKKLDELREEQKESGNDMNLENTKEAQESIQKSINNSKSEIQKRNNKKAAQGQRNSAKEMRNLANDLEAMQQEAENDQLAEDANSIRNILENLVRLSFRQENLMNMIKSTGRNDPKYLKLIDEQVEIGERLKVSEDSLNAIAKRQVNVRNVILKELSNLRKEIQNSVGLLNTRSMSEALIKEQYAMTSMNNLALLLDESLEKMNEEMESMSGKQQSSCKRPSSKGGKAAMKGMRQMQEQLGNDLEKMKSSLEKMKSGGKQGKQEEGQLDRELARLAAQQEAIRNELTKYKESLLEGGDKQAMKDMENLSKTIDEMENMEKEMVNKRISQESIKRQQRIMTRMLESEKAEQQRDKEEKRESVEAKSQIISNPAEDFKYKMKREKQAEILKLEPLPVNRYFKGKIESYSLSIEKP